MYDKTVAGFSLIEVLVSLLLLSFMILSFQTMQIYSLQTMQTAYYFHIANNQLMQMVERLRTLDKNNGLTDQLQKWNKQNQELLPQGVGKVVGQYPFFEIILIWGDYTNNCEEIIMRRSGCLKKKITL